MNVTFRLLEIDGTEWLDEREFPDTASDDEIQAAAEAWAANLVGELSWWVE